MQSHAMLLQAMQQRNKRNKRNATQRDKRSPPWNRRMRKSQVRRFGPLRVHSEKGQPVPMRRLDRQKGKREARMKEDQKRQCLVVSCELPKTREGSRNQMLMCANETEQKEMN
jgi:hypothetical protein